MKTQLLLLVLVLTFTALPQNTAGLESKTNFQSQIKSADYSQTNYRSGLANVSASDIWLPDSVILYKTYDSLKTYFTYDEQNRLSIKRTMRWKDGGWVNISKNTYTYNPAGKLTVLLQQAYENDNWVNKFMETSTYNDAGKLSTRITDRWYDNTEWVHMWKNILTYDQQNRKTEQLSQIWSGEWVDESRGYFTYNESDLLIYELHEVYWPLSGVWDTTQIITREYNESGLISRILDRIFIVAFPASQVSERTFIYDYQLVTETLRDSTDEHDWQNKCKTTYTYNANDERILEIRYLWIDSIWVKRYRQDYAFSFDGYINGLSFIRDGDNWIPEDETMDIISPQINYTGQMGYMIDLYCTSVTGVEDPLETVDEYALFQNYPNPFNPQTRINFRLPYASTVKITVYDMLGRVVDLVIDKFLPAGMHSVNFNGEDISSGVYIYRIEAASENGHHGFTDTAKMILLK